MFFRAFIAQGIHCVCVNYMPRRAVDVVLTT
jgi:hypothetical protein